MSGAGAVFVGLWICLGAGVWAWGYGASDFAAEVVYYDAGSGGDKDWLDGRNFDDANNALGRPTVDTTGDNLNIAVGETVPVVAVYPAFRSFEVVTVGKGGQLILKFDHRVADDENNRYGVDFIVFGNAQTFGMRFWANRDPEAFVVTGDRMISESAAVSVSQDGENWYRYEDGPWADDFAPTLGRVYDPDNTDETIGDWNMWWAEATDPTVPLDPALGIEDIAGLTVAEAAQLYGRSAGGTGFDIAESGLEWIQYVRIEGNETVTPEVDAISDAACCGDYMHPMPQGDINGDCRVDHHDVRLISDYWLVRTDAAEDQAKAADLYEDDIVNGFDWSVVAAGWGQCSWECE